MIVKDEQHGSKRADYAKQMLINLSDVLTKEYGKGYSTDNLELMRKFYLSYSQISETASRKSSIQKSETTSRKFNNITDFANALTLGWSHYVQLIKIDNKEERTFYEIEAHTEQLECTRITTTISIVFI